MNNKEIIKSLTYKGYTFQEAVGLLREHNLTGKPVSVITEGAMYERPLMISFLDVVEKREELLKDIYHFIHMLSKNLELSTTVRREDDLEPAGIFIDETRKNNYVNEILAIEKKMKEQGVI